MRKFLVSLVLAATLAPSAANAGLVLGGRLGVAFPGGDVVKDSKLADSVDWAVPFQLDLGYRIGQQLTLGGYLRVAPGKLDSAVKDSCDLNGQSCSSWDIGLGAQVDFRFRQANAGPWLGAFAGYERLRSDTTEGPDTLSLSLSGWEIGAQGGIDFTWGVLALGPYGAIGAGQFTTGKVELNGTEIDSGSITDKGTHTWIQVGLRVGFAF